MSAQFTFRNSATRKTELHELTWYGDFLDAHVRKPGLQIAPHLTEIRDEPVFIVAATGVGKTVGVPVHLFIRLCQQLLAKRHSLRPAPSVLVVEPTIPICRSEADHMNSVFQAFLSKRGLASDVHPFGAVTGAWKYNVQAPIRFITTGVFERMAEDLSPDRSRVVIDEAHRVLAQSPGVEIAACVARSRGVCVDWMSATVDISDLAERFGAHIVSASEKRFPILKIPTHSPLQDCVGDLAVRCLTEPSSVVPPATDYPEGPLRQECERSRLHLLAPQSFRDPVDGQRYPGLSERPQGMLVVVNSHRGENSDTRRIADRILGAARAAAVELEVLRLASPVIRDPDQEASFRRRVRGVEARNGRYVVVATNVVEMGVTFPSLDYVVTMDTELETVRANGANVVQERPLSVNAFFQRIGRVGRRRPGMALLTREGDKGPAFSARSLAEIADGLRLEPISFAISCGVLSELAFFLYEREVPAPVPAMREYLARGRMPSRPENSEALLNQLGEHRRLIRAAGLSDDGRRLNARGRRFRKIGVVADLEFGGLLVRCLEGRPNRALAFMALAAAANPGGVRELLGRHTWLDDKEPYLSQVVSFARSDFRGSLALVTEHLRAKPETVDARVLGTDESLAARLAELLADGYRLDAPRMVERDDAAKDPAVLTLSRRVIALDTYSEVLATYDILSWFIPRFRADLADRNLAAYEQDRVRSALREEAGQIGIDPGRLLGVMTRFSEIARHADIELGSQISAERIPAPLLETLARASSNVRPTVGPRENKRRLLSAYRSTVAPTMSISWPDVTSNDRRQFLQIIGEMDLFVPCQLTPGENERGREVLEGEAQHDGRTVSVEIETSHTSLRLSRRTRVRGRVLPLPYVAANGDPAVRYILTSASVTPS